MLWKNRFSSPKVLVLANHDTTIYNFRLELIEKLLENGYEVHISSPYGERIENLVVLGIEYHNIHVNRHGINPVTEFLLVNEIKRLIKEVHPNIILTYTIKPNIYGGIVASQEHIPFIANITGLGTSIEKKGIEAYFVLCLYKFGLKKAHMVYFQNQENQRFMIDHHIINGKYDMLPGSGVNLKKHRFEKYPSDTKRLIFTSICRIMKEKGIDELLEAAKRIKLKYPEISFRLIGPFEDNYQSKIEKAEQEGTIKYIGQQKDVHPYIKESHAIINPSYHEGMSNVLLEAAATGRPVLASDIPGCRETFDEGISGFGFKPKDTHNLVKVIENFINLSYEEKEAMGQAGRRKMEQYFDRNIVVEKYMMEMDKILEEQKNVYRAI